MERLSALVFVLFVFGCSPDLPDRNELVQSMYDQKVKSLKAKKDAICKDNLLDKAIADVDSLVHHLINRDLMDTLDFPGKPIKPSAQKHIIGEVEKFKVDNKK